MSDAVDALKVELDGLQDLNRDQLRARWRKLFRKDPPDHLPRPLLIRMVAHRMQVKVHGDLDGRVARYLDRIVRSTTRSALKAVPVLPPWGSSSLTPGTVLVREHNDHLHQVIVVQDGFCWNGRTYRSLSEVARAITGTNWNGPRFFGLRNKELAS